VLQENVRRLVTAVISRENLKESFARLNPDGSLLRMSRGYAQANLDGFLESSCMTFPKWGIMSGGVAGGLLTLEPVTEENGFLLLPTLMGEAAEMTCAGKEYCGTRHSLKLGQALNMLPTLLANEGGAYQRDRGIKGKERPTLTGVIRLLPTCTSRDYKDTGKMENVPVNSLLGRELGKNHGLKLQPGFAEWMMGYPMNWTDLNDTPIVSHQGEREKSGLSASEMPLSRSRSTRSSKRLQTLKEESK
jgi:hypothetical protein